MADPGLRTETSEPTSGRESVPREAWLDAFRGLAVLGMIETHTVNTMLGEGWRTAPEFGRLTYANGLVAPVFLWIAGYAHGVASKRRPTSMGWPVRTVRRLVFIMIVAYLIHLPVPGSGATWNLFFGVDVLQCLTASLLLVVSVQRWLPRWQDTALVAASVATLAAGALPVAAVRFGTGFWPLEAWLDQSGVSLFPLVPWAAFVFLGVLMAKWPWPAWTWLLVGAGLVVLPWPPFISKGHPYFFIERFGWLMVVAGLARTLGKWISFPRWLQWVGRESLGMYLAHLALLYLVPTPRWVGPQLGPALTALAAIVLALVSAGLVWVWRWGRTRGWESAAHGMGRAFSP